MPLYGLSRAREALSIEDYDIEDDRNDNGRRYLRWYVGSDKNGGDGQSTKGSFLHEEAQLGGISRLAGMKLQSGLRPSRIPALIER